MSDPLLLVEGLGKSFGGLVALDDLGFAIDRGEIVGLIGPNGSGKTTAINLISGLMPADRGRIRFDGIAIEGWPAHRIARAGIARTFQLVRVFADMSCHDNVLLSLAHGRDRLWGGPARQRCEALLVQVGLADAAGRAAGDLTYIDQKRLELARALALDPALLLLDEWLAGLNPSEMQQAMALVRAERERGRSVLLVEHVMDAIRALCDRCVVVAAGRRLAVGPPASVLALPEVVRAYLGDDDAGG